MLFFTTAYPQKSSELKVVVEGLRNEKGKLSITLFNGPEGFPEDVDKAMTWQTIELSSEEPVFLFEDLPRGVYAYAILHDENGDGKMNKNLLGMPKEGFAFSNNYEPKIKNPSYKQASFPLKPGKNRHEIKILYFL
jgi:uncharacterized protein (DUF2141 family)